MTEEHDSPATSETFTRPSPLWIGVGAAAFLIGFGVLQAAGKSAPGDAATPQAERIALVEVAEVAPAPRTFKVRAPGRLQAREQLAVVGEVSGKVVEIHPQLGLGGRIKKGEVILRIDPGDVRADQSRAEAQVATAKSRLAQAKAERDRQVRLADIGAAPESVREQAIAGYADAEAALKQAESQLTISSRGVGKTAIRAPYDAIVVRETVTLGAFVAPGAELARLIGAGPGELVAGLTPADVKAVRATLASAENGKVAVRAVPNSGSISVGSLDGYIESFSPVIDPRSRTVSVVAVFPDAFSAANDGLVFADDFMTLEIEARSDEPLYALPAGAVRQDSWVWVVDDTDVIHRREVRPVDRTDATVLVSADLAGVRRVMTTVLAEEIDGMKVRISEGVGK